VQALFDTALRLHLYLQVTLLIVAPAALARWVATFAVATVVYEAATVWAGPHYLPVGRMSGTFQAATQAAARDGEVARILVI
jgi:hypothetical protein